MELVATDLNHSMPSSNTEKAPRAEWTTTWMINWEETIKLQQFKEGGKGRE
jgi:hypothetical protein